MGLSLRQGVGCGLALVPETSSYFTSILDLQEMKSLTRRISFRKASPCSKVN